jgi:hypothetical protein
MQNGINVAIYNVCLEFWLLIHLKDTSAPYSSFDDLCKASEFKKLYKEFTGHEYEKNASRVFSALYSGLQDARNRAARINRNSVRLALAGRQLPYNLNPYTNVHELLVDIEALA